MSLLPVPLTDPYERYVATTMFQLPDQQSITNWVGTATQQAQYSNYMARVQLCHNGIRPLQRDDEILFLHSNQHRFTPHRPWDTLCYMGQL